MKSNRQFLIVMLTAIFVTLTACQSTDEQGATTNSEDLEINNGSNQTDESKDSLDADIELSEENEGQDGVTDQTIADEKNEENPSASKEPIQITSGEEAVQYLKQHLKEGTNDDISFGTDGKLETDHKNSFYTIQLVDIPLRVSGKTGNLGYYKVYQDGTYEPYQMNSSNRNSEMANNKEEYLKKLNELDKEMEELRQNSEATTTRDMEEEAAYIFKIWDTELNDIYDVLKEQLKKEQMDKLREEQRNWITYRDETAKKAAMKYEGGSMELLEYVSVQATLTKDRCHTLVENYMK